MKDYILERLHSVEVEILDEIVRICEKYQLKYYLVGGTLLGAVRHGGFIPWDDDLDIGMPRPDYIKFCKLCDTELNCKYYLHSSELDNDYWLPFVKVRKKDTVFVEGLLEKSDNRYNGIYVDIFPLDFAKHESTLAKRFRTSLYKNMMYLIGYRKQRRVPQKMSSRIIFFATQFIRISTFRKWQDNLMQWENRITDVRYFVNYASQYDTIKQTMSLDIYEPYGSLPFCGKQYRVPGRYEDFLKRLYGKDYLRLPPHEKRRTHNPIRLSFDINGPDEKLVEDKHYKVGYTTGVFDLFHIGHLNLLNRAKERCDYLIVGVSTDENVRSYKHKTPVIPYEQRKAIVEALRCVDQVVPQETMNKLEAWDKWHFDVMFHGSDWKGSVMFDAAERELRTVGCDVVFLPHTDGISSTILKEKKKD